MYNWTIIDEYTLKVVCIVDDLIIQKIKNGYPILPGGMILYDKYPLANIKEFTYSLTSTHVTILFDCCYSYSSNSIKECIDTSIYEGMGYIPTQNGIYPYITLSKNTEIIQSICVKKTEFFPENLSLIIDGFKYSLMINDTYLEKKVIRTTYRK